MGLMQEGLRRSGETRNALAPVNLNPSEIKINRLPIAESGLEIKIREISRMFSVEEKEGKKTKGPQPQETSKNGFEPFVNPQCSDNPLFVNGYNGNFAQQMELNRQGVERVLKIAHLDGKVVLTSLAPSRNRSVDEVNQDGSVAQKRKFFFGEKLEDDNKENPFRRIIPTPEGWRIEINDGRIMEELAEKRLYFEKKQEIFIETFNRHLKQGIWNCVLKEKFSSVKDKTFKVRAAFVLLSHGLPPYVFLSDVLNGELSSSFLLVLPYSLMSIAFANAMNKILKGLYPIPIGRINTDHAWEYFMPYVEIDKVARSWAFLSLKGRTLVREANSEAK